ncbi:hypothetical protein HPB47_025452 [Ixodes persulcatus]|uniref:Uncharacterized protein n=1 Tax=Ixodes persulcatus TaxID=34615 RepID=A0AC60Q3B3_IXOPE|nr:hypothetical protein HPB47_025452 [Ixodes persulcatus]
MQRCAVDADIPPPRKQLLLQFTTDNELQDYHDMSTYSHLFNIPVLLAKLADSDNTSSSDDDDEGRVYEAKFTELFDAPCTVPKVKAYVSIVRTYSDKVVSKESSSAWGSMTVSVLLSHSRIRSAAVAVKSGSNGSFSSVQDQARSRSAKTPASQNARARTSSTGKTSRSVEETTVP